MTERNEQDREATDAEPVSNVHADGRTGQEHTDAWDDFEQQANQERVEREGR